VRKSIIDRLTIKRAHDFEQDWLAIEQLAEVEVTSEDPNFPIESALLLGKGSDWRAAEKVEQLIRIVFNSPRIIRRNLAPESRAIPAVEMGSDEVFEWPLCLWTSDKRFDSSGEVRLASIIQHGGSGNARSIQRHALSLGTQASDFRPEF
jgi:hypothetical protein